MSKVEFIDTSQECKKMMVKLSKGALRDAGRVVTKTLRKTVPVRTGGLKKSIKAWVKINYKTGQPYMDIGYLNRKQMKKRGVRYFVNPAWFEFGTKPHTIMTKEYKNTGKSSYQLQHNKKYGIIVKHPGMQNKNFLRNTVMNNIDQIKKAQQEKLGQLTKMMIQKGANIDIGGAEEID